MAEKKQVKDSDLEQVNGGAGIMENPISEKLASVGPGSSNSELAEAGHDLSNDMILNVVDGE